jgi:hypothetical protein
VNAYRCIRGRTAQETDAGPFRLRQQQQEKEKFMTPICNLCGHDVCKPCAFKPANENSRTIIVASEAELCRRSHFQRLSMATRALGISRREIPNWMADVIFGFRGRIMWPDGKVFEVGDEDIDAAFNDDGSFRWLSDFLHFASVNPKQKPQERVIVRLRLIDLAFRIAYPERAAWIAK